MTFAALGLMEPILRAVADTGYVSPTPIQTIAIPPVLEGRDVFGCAQTGTGKTGAFAMPILHRLAVEGGSGVARSGRHPASSPRALVLCPTRELALQILDSFRTYGQHLPLRHAVVHGGVSQHHQVRALRAGVDVLVATPGRLLDLVSQRLVHLGAIELFVLDEADRMLDMGFIRDIRKIVELVPTDRQTLLFSATMPGEIRALADAILRNPSFVQADRVASTATGIDQFVHVVPNAGKAALLQHLLRQDDAVRTLVFTRTKHGADKLVKVLRRNGFDADAIHGNKAQNARVRALDAFRSGVTPVLVATDIAARGIDVDGITHVVNYDIPDEAETYVHRIGRTARAGATGTAISFCDPSELREVRAIERVIGRSLRVVHVEGAVVTDASDADEVTLERDTAPARREGGRGPGRMSRSPRGNGTHRSATGAPNPGRERTDRDGATRDSGRRRGSTDSNPRRTSTKRGASTSSGRQSIPGAATGASGGASTSAASASGSRSRKRRRRPHGNGTFGASKVSTLKRSSTRSDRGRVR